MPTGGSPHSEKSSRTERGKVENRTIHGLRKTIGGRLAIDKNDRQEEGKMIGFCLCK